jgi:polysaccharide export outer membrane protein
MNSSVLSRFGPALRAVLVACATAALLVPAARAQAPAAPTQPSAAPAASPEYRLAAGDSVRITTFQNPDLSLETRISESGSVSFPLLGNVKLNGLTTGQAERLIENGLKSGNFVKQPQVSVVVVQVRGNQVSVLGQVARPGRYPIETGQLRLTDLIASAGGIAPTGSDIVVVVGTRNGKPFRAEVDFPRVFMSDRRTEDVLLQNEDVVYVDRAPTIYMYGEVQRPGAQRLERGLTLLQALAASGGVTQRGTEKGIRVNRRLEGGKVQVLQPSMDEPLRDGDVLYVRESLF